MKPKGYKWNESDWDYGSIRDRHFIVHRPDCPTCITNGQAKRAHVVYWLKTGVVPQKGECIHHVNGDPLDDRFENLKLMPHGQHSKDHVTKPMRDLICTHCGKTYQLPTWRINRKEKIGTLEYFCSMPCRAQHKWDKGAKEPLMAGAKLACVRSHEKADRVLVCMTCGKEYHLIASYVEHRKKMGYLSNYCSTKCQHDKGISEEQRKKISTSMLKVYAEGRR